MSPCKVVFRLSCDFCFCYRDSSYDCCFCCMSFSLSFTVFSGSFWEECSVLHSLCPVWWSQGHHHSCSPWVLAPQVQDQVLYRQLRTCTLWWCWQCHIATQILVCESCPRPSYKFSPKKYLSCIPHIFKCQFPFSFNSKDFLIPLVTYLWSLSYLELYCLISKLQIFQLTLYYWFLV